VSQNFSFGWSLKIQCVSSLLKVFSSVFSVLNGMLDIVLSVKIALSCKM